jgi:VWFA-related protein
MTKRLVAAVLLIIAALPARSMRAQSTPRAMYVSIVDQAGNPVPGLGPSDFVIREDKVAREVLNVEPATDPMQVALLIDNSQAAENYITDYRSAFAAFITAMTTAEPPVKHQVAIITVGERPTINTEYTSDPQLLTKGAQRLFSVSGSGSYLLDGIVETSTGLLKRGEARPVIVAVLTNGSELSNRTYDYVLERLNASGATLHVIVVGQPVVAPNDLAITLDRGTRSTGGRYDTVLAATALTSRMKQMAAELTHQYKVTYARPDRLIPPEQVTVEAKKPGLTARGIPVKSEDRK